MLPGSALNSDRMDKHYFDVVGKPMFSLSGDIIFRTCRHGLHTLQPSKNRKQGVLNPIKENGGTSLGKSSAKTQVLNAWCFRSQIFASIVIQVSHMSILINDYKHYTSFTRHIINFQKCKLVEKPLKIVNWLIHNSVIRSVPLLGATRLAIPRPGGPLWLATLCPGEPQWLSSPQSTSPCPRP